MAEPFKITLGTGIHDLSYYSTEVIFKDAFLQSEPFWNQKHSSHWPNLPELKVLADDLFDSGGMPLRDPVEGWWRTHMRKGLNGKYEAGKYFLITDAKATFILGVDANKTFHTDGYPFTSNVFVVNPTDEGISLIIKNIIRPPTFIHIIHEGYLGDFMSGSPFHPLFLRNISHYKVLRFMDACGAFSQFGDGQPGRTWRNRTTKRQSQNRAGNKPHVPAFTHSGHTRYWSSNYGMNYEYMAELCNTVNADCYICIPPLATKEFAIRMIRLIRKILRPALKLYVEWSNEIWNHMFPQSGAFALLADSSPTLNFPYHKYWFRKGDPDAAVNNLLSLAWQAQRMKETMPEIWAEFGKESVYSVFAFQTANTWNANEILRMNNYADFFTHISCNAYFGHNENCPWGSDLTTWRTYLFNKLQELGEQLRSVKSLANSVGKKVIAYEGGQHIIGTDPTKIEEWNRIQRTYVISDVYKALMNLWVEIFGSESPMIHYYNTGRWGSFGTWGAQENLLDLNSPKFCAMLEAVSTWLPDSKKV